MSEPQTVETTTRTESEALDTELLAVACAEIAWDVKARSVRVLDVRGIVSYADFLVICHGTSEKHAKSIAEEILRELRPTKIRPLGVEGLDHGRWILIDYGDIVVHVFLDTVRAEYGLESIYSDAPRLDIETPEDLEDPAAQ